MSHEEAPVRRGRPPRPPRHLGPDAQRYWRSQVGELWAREDLSVLRRDLLARYCEMAVIADEAMRWLAPGVLLRKGRGDVRDDVRGRVVTNPAWRIYRDAVKAQLELARELGFRTRA